MESINGLIIVSGVVVGIIAGYFIRKNISEAKIGQAENLAKEIIDKANKDSETVQKEKLLEAKEEIHKLRAEAEKENKERRNELQKFERRVIQKEETLDKKLLGLEQKESSLTKRMKDISKKEEEVEKIKNKQLETLEAISSITTEQAREIILTNAEKDVRREMSLMIKEMRILSERRSRQKSKRNYRICYSKMCSRPCCRNYSNCCISTK